MTQPADGDEFRSHWFAFPIAQFLHDSDPDGPPLSIELRSGGRPAVVEGDRTLSFTDLLAGVRTVAAGYVALGLEPGDRVRCEIEGIGVVENPIVDWTDDPRPAA